MLDRIRELFADKDVAAPAPSQNLHVAACALLLEVAWADHDMAPAELAQVSIRMQRIFDLPAHEAEAIIRASREAHDDSVGLYAYTRLLNEALSIEEKTEVLAAMWSVAYAEDGLDRFEEATIRRVADLLYVPHANFIATKIDERDPN
ncbi:MAG: TerB family tellurite resistance protein [Pseudomonadota bacterium]